MNAVDHMEAHINPYESQPVAKATTNRSSTNWTIPLVCAVLFSMLPVVAGVKATLSFNEYAASVPDDEPICGTGIALAQAGAVILVPIFAVVGLSVGFFSKYLFGWISKFGKTDDIQSIECF